MLKEASICQMMSCFLSGRKKRWVIFISFEVVDRWAKKIELKKKRFLYYCQANIGTVPFFLKR